jgi:hypothetical protein
MIKSNIRCLVTAGCSYSQVPNRDAAWPIPLHNYLKPAKTLFLGQGAAGNGIISRKVIKHVTKMLETYKPENMLVCIMWSGYDRREYYSTTPQDTTYIDCANNAYRNPLNINQDDKECNWYLLNNHWDDTLTTTFYKHFFNEQDSLIIAIEHILRTQWFLEMHKIPYFMTQYDYDTFGEWPSDKKIIFNNQELNFLHDQIDFSKWLPINNLYEWAKYESGFDFARPPDPHPSTEQHKAFVDKIVIPYLLDKRIISDIIV